MTKGRFPVQELEVTTVNDYGETVNLKILEMFHNSGNKIGYSRRGVIMIVEGDGIFATNNPLTICQGPRKELNDLINRIEIEKCPINVALPGERVGICLKKHKKPRLICGL